MGVWRSTFGWDALFRWDVFSALVLGVLLAIGIFSLTTDWLPHNFSVSQVCFGIIALLIVIKIIHHAVHTDGSPIGRVSFVILLSVFILLLIIPLETQIQRHKTTSPFTRLIPVTVDWNPPAPIEAGTPLSHRELNATASVKGTFVYNPTFGATLNPGTSTLSVTFLPDEPDKYQEKIKTILLSVNSPRAKNLPPSELSRQTLKASDITVRACSTTLIPGDTGVKAAQRFVGPSECSIMIFNNSKIMLKDATLRIHITPKRLKIKTTPPATQIPSKSGTMAMVGESYEVHIPVTLVKGGTTFPLSIQLPAFHARVEIQLEIIQDNGLPLGVWRVDLIPLHESGT